MKSFVGSVVLVLSAICFVNGESSVKVTAPQKNPDQPNKCWDEASQTAYSVGSHNPKDSCQRIHCYPDFRIKYTTCGTHSAGEGYTIEQDLTQDYPHCCAKLVKVEAKKKRTDSIGASEVRINKFRSRERAVEPKEKKVETQVPTKLATKLAPKPAKITAEEEITEEETPNVNNE